MDFRPMDLRPMDPSPLAPLVHAAMASPRFSPPVRPLRLPSLAPSLPKLPLMIHAVSGGLASHVAPAAPVSAVLTPPVTQTTPLLLADADSPSQRNQGALSFILNPSLADASAVAAQSLTRPLSALPLRESPAPAKKKRKTRICKAEGCEKYVVDRGLCIRHGGGKRCSVEGCNCRAQNRGLCWKHGGYTQCTVEGCTKRAKSRGICWSHGGGTRCKHPSCTKIAVSHGLCWAHGGGKRCLVDSCQKPAYERNGNLCAEHCHAAPPLAHRPVVM